MMSSTANLFPVWWCELQMEAGTQFVRVQDRVFRGGKLRVSGDAEQ